MSKAERDAKYTKDRRERGDCGYGGCQVKSGDEFYCSAHREVKASKERRRRERRKDRACLTRP